MEAAVHAYVAAVRLLEEFDDWLTLGAMLEALAEAHETARDPARARAAALPADDSDPRL